MRPSRSDKAEQTFRNQSRRPGAAGEIAVRASLCWSQPRASADHPLGARHRRLPGAPSRARLALGHQPVTGSGLWGPGLPAPSRILKAPMKKPAFRKTSP